MARLAKQQRDQVRRIDAQRIVRCIEDGPPRLRLRRCAAPRGGAIRALGRPCGAHCLTAPAVMPRTMYRCRNTNARTSGALASTEYAIIMLHSVTNSASKL